MRIERVGLEHHGDAALGRREVVHPLAADEEIARRDVLEPGDEAQQGRFSAAGGADEDDELAVANVEIDAVDDLHPAEGFLHVLEDDISHLKFP